MTRRLALTEAERVTLEEAVKHHPKAYARERAAALLKVADRSSGLRVAEHGLLRRRAADTVSVAGPARGARAGGADDPAGPGPQAPLPPAA
ncbi:MAG: hypothetical protein U0893_21740 [Chloroflexota bacterium]